MKRLMFATIAAGALMAGTANAALVDLVTDVFGAVGASTQAQGANSATGASGIKYNGFLGTGGSVSVSGATAQNIAYVNFAGLNDRGLGICSEGNLACSTLIPENPQLHVGGLSDAGEVLRLERPSGFVWSDIVIASLDVLPGNIPFDQALIGWGNNADGSGAQTAVVTNTGAPEFNGNADKAGSILNQLSAAQITGIRNSQYLFFANPNHGNLDTYLVQAVGLDPVRAPEPASLALFGAALAGLGIARRRK